MKLIIALYLLFLQKAFLVSADRRIHYGKKVNSKIPYVIALIEDPGRDSLITSIRQWWYRDQDYYNLVCAGTLFATHWVVTAAHCIQPNKKRLHFAGVDGLNFRNMAKYHQIVYSVFHNKFVPAKPNMVIDYDIGLVKTKTSMRIQSPIVAYMNIEPLSFVGNGPFVIYGWGLTESGRTETLKQIEVKYEENLCKRFLANQQGRMLCFKPTVSYERVDSGDSGSPILLKTPDPLGGDTVVSLITGSLGSLKDVQLINGPNISYFRPWIDLNTNRFDDFN